MARPTKYKPEYCERMISYMGKGRSYEAFAGNISVSKQTLYTWEKQYPEFLDAKRIARGKCQEKLEDWGEKLINGTYKGNASMLIFLMKNMTGFRDDPLQDDEDGIDGVEFIDSPKEDTPY